MLTVEKLRSLGADVDDGIGRCLDKAFDRAHALKGTLANVALTSLADPMIEITEELRARRDMDYTELPDRIDRVLADYRSLL